jgi:hypothetical protein
MQQVSLRLQGLAGDALMSSDTIDPSKKRFMVSIYEIQQQIVFADEFSDRYAKSVMLSDGTTRTVELKSVMCDGRPAVEFNDTGHRKYMELLPIRNNGQTNVSGKPAAYGLRSEGMQG